MLDDERYVYVIAGASVLLALATGRRDWEDALQDGSVLAYGNPTLTSQLSGWFLPADGAFYLYADVSDFADDSFAFAGQMLEKAHVAATPGVDFDPVHGRAFIRFSYARSADEMREAVARLTRWLG